VVRHGAAPDPVVLASAKPGAALVEGDAVAAFKGEHHGTVEHGVVLRSLQGGAGGLGELEPDQAVLGVGLVDASGEEGGGLDGVLAGGTRGFDADQGALHLVEHVAQAVVALVAAAQFAHGDGEQLSRLPGVAGGLVQHEDDGLRALADGEEPREGGLDQLAGGKDLCVGDVWAMVCAALIMRPGCLGDRPSSGEARAVMTQA